MVNLKGWVLGLAARSMIGLNNFLVAVYITGAIYSYFEKGCPKKSTRQSRKAGSTATVSGTVY